MRGFAVQERLKQMEREAQEQEEQERLATQMMKDKILRSEEEARRRQEQPVEDSEIVEEVFGFLPDREQGSPPKA